MNLIANNCVGARLYEVTKQQFPNPFMWMTIPVNDYIDLMENYDSIDLNNPKFELEVYKQNTYKTILVTLNNRIKLHYIHYIQDDTKQKPVKELNTNILYKDILPYFKEKWYRRLKRNTEKPVFLYSFNYSKKYGYNETLKQLLNVKIKYKLIILVHKGVQYTNKNTNIKVLECDDSIMELNGGALARKIKDMIFKK